MIRFINPYKIILLLLLFICYSGVQAQIKLPSIFTDNMVLQQKAKVPFWGTAEPKKELILSTSWNGKILKVTTDDSGKWQTTIKTPVYGGPYSITIKGNDELVLKNILIGEVWLCSGQSNMEMPLGGWGEIKNYKEEIKNADFPKIRLLQAEHIQSEEPLTDLNVQHGGWQVCNSASIEDFSATAYFFARKIWEEEHIPIGLIHSSWGGTVIEAWTSHKALTEVHYFDAVLKAMQNQGAEKKLQENYNHQMQIWNDKLETQDLGMNMGLAVWSHIALEDTNWETIALPGYWEQSALPAFDGVVWFRKKINLSKEDQVKDLELHFYADDNDKVWFNGELIGETAGFNLPRAYTIDKSLINAGENVITIRVYDQTGEGGIYGKQDQLFLQSGNKTISLSGNWKYRVGSDLKNMPAQPYLPQAQNRPTVLFNAMIHPLLKLPLAGVIWYQGESNADRAHQYNTLFPLMIRDWRSQFSQKNLPFYFVQLANFMNQKETPTPSAWAELRDAQFNGLQLPHTGMAVIIDIGNSDNIHPKNKQEVGRRLALIALAKNYGKKIEYSGPLYTSFKKKDNSIIIDFDHAKGLHAESDQLKGFEIAGKDHIFHWANASIDGNTIAVSSPEVNAPIAVRYSWADNPKGNLYNHAGLPASPFRTDNWPGITDSNH